MIPRHQLIHSLYSRAQVLCLTRGLTDGIEDLPEHPPHVVFPVNGFCETYVEEFAGLEKTPRCTAFRFEVEAGYTTANCENIGNLSTARWEGNWGNLFSSHADDNMRKGCASMYFGEGLNPNVYVPALHDVDSTEIDPLHFGCMAKDLRFKVTPGWFNQPIFDIVEFSCARPAYGPGSRSWSLTPLTTGKYIAPKQFFKNNPMSPIEMQVDACKDLNRAFMCDDDPCYNYVDDMNGNTCDNFCQEKNLVCVAAYHEHNNTCYQKNQSSACSHKVKSFDVLCRCELPEKSRKCGLLPAAFRRCDGDPCKVLVTKIDLFTGEQQAHKTCTAYCEANKMTCVEQYAVRRHTCAKIQRHIGEIKCDTPIVYATDSIVPIRVCHCG